MSGAQSSSSLGDVRDVIVIGAGHNGLTTAAYLARAGLRPLVLEARNIVGGRSVTEEIHPGFRCPTVLHTAGPLLPQVSRDLELSRHGLEWLVPEVRVLAPTVSGAPLVIYDDPARTAQSLRPLSAKDADAYPQFAASLARIGSALAPMVSMTPPAIAAPQARDFWNALKLGKRLRGLGKKDIYRLLRWGPMAIADLSAEWFEHPTLRAVIAARGIHGCFAGPWSAGTSAGLLLQAAFDGQATGPAAMPRGGLGSLTTALAASARAHGAEIRTGARVKQILVEEGAVAGVTLEGGQTLRARAVVSGVDPRQTFLQLVDPAELGPDFAGKMRNYRCLGAAAKVNLALSKLPRWNDFGTACPPSALGGRIHIGSDIDHLERAFDAAKYGEISPRPYLDITIPSLGDPALAPTGAHVVSIHVQFAPYRLRTGSWTERRQELLEIVLSSLAEHVGDLRPLVVAAQVLTPVDLESEYGLTGGHLLHGEPALDQLFTFRPLLGWSQYRSPVAGLYLCGSGTHPGGAVTGASGANASREILRDLRSGGATRRKA